jgi:hypothetical protein
VRIKQIGMNSYPILFSYIITYKVATRYTPYQLVYGLHPLMPTKYIMPTINNIHKEVNSMRVLTSRLSKQKNYKRTNYNLR